MITNQAYTKAKQGSIILFQSVNNWKGWETKLFNSMSALIVLNGFPLFYVVQKNENPYAKGGFPYLIDKKRAYE